MLWIKRTKGKYSPFNWIHSHRTRDIQIVFDKNFSHISIKVSQFNCALQSVSEIDVIVNPVHSQAIGSYRMVPQDNGFVTSFINGGPRRISEMKTMEKLTELGRIEQK